MRRLAALLRESSTLTALQALAGLGLIIAGAAAVSIPAALLLAGLLIWRDATEQRTEDRGQRSNQPPAK